MFEIILGIIGTGMLGSLGWLFISVTDAHKKVALLEQDIKEFLPELLDTKLENVNFRLERIEKGMNGHLKGK